MVRSSSPARAFRHDVGGLVEPHAERGRGSRSARSCGRRYARSSRGRERAVSPGRAAIAIGNTYCSGEPCDARVRHRHDRQVRARAQVIADRRLPGDRDGDPSGCERVQDRRRRRAGILDVSKGSACGVSARILSPVCGRRLGLVADPHAAQRRRVHRGDVVVLAFRDNEHVRRDVVGCGSRVTFVAGIRHVDHDVALVRLAACRCRNWSYPPGPRVVCPREGDRVAQRLGAWPARSCSRSLRPRGSRTACSRGRSRRAACAADRVAPRAAPPESDATSSASSAPRRLSLSSERETIRSPPRLV